MINKSIWKLASSDFVNWPIRTWNSCYFDEFDNFVMSLLNRIISLSRISRLESNEHMNNNIQCRNNCRNLFQFFILVKICFVLLTKIKRNLKIIEWTIGIYCRVFSDLINCACWIWNVFLPPLCSLYNAHLDKLTNLKLLWPIHTAHWTLNTVHNRNALSAW